MKDRERFGLDRLFDDALARAGGGQPAADPYGEGPLASDHFLLTKSWAYFKHRLESIERQYAEILQARDEQIRALQSRMGQTERNSEEDGRKRRAVDEIEQAFLADRFADFRSFADNMRRLTESWEEERIRLEERIGTLEAERDRAKADGESKVARQKDAGALEMERRAAAESERDRLAERIGQLEKAAQSREAELLEAVAARDRAIDLLRAEVERRGAEVRQAGDVLETERRRSAESSVEASDLRRLVVDQERRQRAVEEELALARREVEQLRAGWEREKADWRELWGRERRLWEERQSGGSDGSR